MSRHIFNNNNAQRIDVLDDRFYKSQIDDTYYPSVTTILDIYPKGFGLEQWKKDNGDNADALLKAAGVQGTNVHNMIDAFLRGERIEWIINGEQSNYTLNEWILFGRFVEFFNTSNLKSLVTEITMVSDNLRYGGTIDCVCKIDGLNWLIDWKTSNGVYKTHELQLAAYAVMWNELNPDYKIDKVGILHLQAKTRGADKTGKKIQGAGWQLMEFDRHYSESFKLFNYTHLIWDEENPNYKPKNLSYPSFYEMKKL